MIETISTLLMTLGPHELNLREFTRALDGGDWLERTAANPMIWGAAIALLGSVMLATVFTARRRRDQRNHGPAFRMLARSMQLINEQCRTLTQLARITGQSNPAPLIISRGCFDRAAQQQYNNRTPAELHALRRQLFD